ncbi:MAG TPA: 3'-5' exonuclease [Ramlibacter sp.]|nr:3'-5' exonuclease [Ramlibacter sp.]
MGWRDWLGQGARGVDESRWVMLDVETSGLNASRDRLLAIAAIALRVDWPRKRLVIQPADSFEVVLRQAQASTRDNILLHGIGAQQQRGGVEAGEALAAFESYAGASPLLAFHAAFDRALIERYLQSERGARSAHRWLDIEPLCAATHPQVRARSLDEWMAHFGIRCAVRHQAAADTLAECELLLRVWPRVAAECANWRDVERMAARQRWIMRP